MEESERRYRNREWLKEKISQGLTAQEIADQTDVSYHAIIKWIHKNDLEELYRHNIPNEYTNVELIEWLVLFYEEFDRFPRKIEFNHPDSPLPVYETFLSHFGEIEKARERAREVMDNE